MLSSGAPTRYEKKMKDKLDDEIKLAGLESLVPEELETHLILRGCALGSCDVCGGEVRSQKSWFQVERHVHSWKFGSHGCWCSQLSLSLSSAKGKGVIESAWWVFKGGGAHFQRDCNARKSTGKQSFGEGRQSKSWSKSEPSHSGQGKSKENKGKSKGKSEGTKSANQGAKGLHKGKTSKTSLSRLEKSKSETGSGICMCSYHWPFLERWLEFWWMEWWLEFWWMEWWLEFCWMARRLGTNVWHFASTFRLEVWMSVPPVVWRGLDGWRWTWTQELQWTYSQWTSVQKVQEMEDSIVLLVANGFLMVKLDNSKDTVKMDRWDLWMEDSHKVLCSAAEIACKGRQDSYFGHDGGYMIPTHSKIGQGMRNHVEKLINWYGKIALIPVYLENNFYLNRSEINRDQTLQRNAAPIGDDIEPVGESRNGKLRRWGEPLEAEISRVTESNESNK